MSKPIKILHVFAKMNRGGAETMIMNLYRNIDRTQIQFDFVVHTEEKCDFDNEIEQLGGRIYHVPKYTGKNHFYYKKVWTSFIKEHLEYEIIHGHVRSTAAIYLGICKSEGRCTIAHSHSTSSGTGFSSIVKNLMQYRIRNIADYFFACSKAAGIWLFGEKVIASNKFYLLNNAIQASSFEINCQMRSKIRSEFDIENKYVIGHIGRFHPTKNHLFLIDIFKNIHSKNKDSILLLAGDGKLRESIEQKVRIENLVDSVIFTGIRSDIPDLLQAIDVFLMPSLFEGLPVSLMEAQASGLKCIVSDTITQDVNITDLVEFVSLKQSAEYWADFILENEKDYKRIDTYNKICESGYDVNKNARWLTDFYIKLSRLER